MSVESYWQLVAVSGRQFTRRIKRLAVAGRKVRDIAQDGRGRFYVVFADGVEYEVAPSFKIDISYKGGLL